MHSCSSSIFFTTFLVLLVATFSKHELEPIRMSRAGISQAMNWVREATSLYGSNRRVGVALKACGELYEDSDERLEDYLVSGERWQGGGEDMGTVLSGAFTSHMTCLDGLEEVGFVGAQFGGQNLTLLLNEALALHAKSSLKRGVQGTFPRSNQNGDLLVSWNASTSRADLIVAKDSSGTHKTINDALDTVRKMGKNRPERVIIYVKSGIYNERVMIETRLQNLTFIGDGIDKTIISNNLSMGNGVETYYTATFDVAGYGFWARDMTFENTAGPENNQAVALLVNADHSVFYKCSMKGYQDTLYVHKSRQFYRDCHIYGTIDFICGDASVVLQNCDIYINFPMLNQQNVITAQKRGNPNTNTGISIHLSRVLPSREFSSINGMIRTYLGRPWGKYSRTVFIKTDLDRLIDPEGWKDWNGTTFALDTLFYGEYMNIGRGASTDKRVKWPGFHRLSDPKDVSPFSVSNLIQGDFWIPVTGVPVTFEI